MLTPEQKREAAERGAAYGRALARQAKQNGGNVPPLWQGDFTSIRHEQRLPESLEDASSAKQDRYWTIAQGAAFDAYAAARGGAA
jgi:uncharacterized FAD-dependent dehydrogenase